MRFWLSLPLLFSIAGAAQETPPVPENFAHFAFEGHEEASQILTEYAWHHFYHRLGNGTTLFNKEYLLVSDMWLGGAVPRGKTESIQEVHRQHLLQMELDDEGYVNTHQHFSHAQDWGWPFPLWTQAGRNREEVMGKTAGWKFQHGDALRGWTAGYLRAWGHEFFGDTAVAAWNTTDLTSHGILENRWRLEKTGINPAITSPEGVQIEAFQAPFFQIRWTCTPEPPKDARGFLEWMGEGDTDFTPAQRMYFYPDTTHLAKEFYHSILPLHEHPNWQGKITRIRIALPAHETVETYDIDSIFCAYDTRHTINNPIFILASDWYFRWSGDLAFLRENINRMRRALIHQQFKMGGLEHNHIRNTWPGHDGLPGFRRNQDGGVTHQPGHGIGNNYWDLMPFGWDDFYATYQYYAATLALAALEKAIINNPQWDIPQSWGTLEPAFLEKHADDVKRTANKKFWNRNTGRFYASIDKNGKHYDYGYTFLNLDAIWYGIASENNAKSIMQWLNGDRLIAEDTSTGADIYHWRFAPRATTVRNIDWYGQGWTSPESIPWGGQVQDGGAVLGFTFYDLWARLQVLGADNAWVRLQEIVAWEKEVRQEGGYRAYYTDGKQGTTLQGGGTAGGLGIDFEFYESSLLPSIVPYGFMGLTPTTEGLGINPKLPSDCPSMTLRNLWFQKARIDVTVSKEDVRVTIHELGREGVTLLVEGNPPSRITQLGTFSFNLK